MTDTPESATAGVAEAIGDLSEQTRRLVRTEVDHAQRELWQRAKRSAPALALGGSAGMMGLFAVASAYRLTLRTMEKVLGPTLAALVATAGFGAGAFFAATKAAEEIKRLPAPVPLDTMKEAGEHLADAAGSPRPEPAGFKP